MKLRLKVLILALTILVSSCGSITAVTDPLPTVAPLVIPENLRISHTEWFCLGKVHDDVAKESIRRAKCPAFIKLGRRDNLKTARIATLNGIINSTSVDKD